ncbi:hypothetical protein B4N84_21210 [Flavobacterium sp. IR1]|nr:hypothetical protein B4N84_21210 [Flavobacterium sp. IR1]
MAKGIKKIKWTGKGKIISKLSTPNKKAVIVGDQVVSFEVDKWYEETAEADKKKGITWILQDRKKNTIIQQRVLLANIPYEILISNKLCGPFEYYLEASLFGKRDLINQTGLFINGYCPPLIVGSTWSETYGGEEVRQKHFFSYGDNVYLNLETEGLNGHKNLRIDIFRHLRLQSDPLVRSIATVSVIDGQINLEISNTHSWLSAVKYSTGSDEFYIKIYDPITKSYVKDIKNDIVHGRFLRFKHTVSSTKVKIPTNLSPLKTGKPEKKEERYELCKFETISITQEGKKQLLFNNGKDLTGESNPKKSIVKAILFNFDEHEITPEAKTILNNVLQYLLGSKNSTIRIDGHACVIGKEQYNQNLSQQRSDAVKKIFVDGGLDSNRIISKGYGEVNPTDDKKGRDNIKYKDEKKNVQNRRVDITFDSYGHNAKTIVYEIVVPSIDENLTIDVSEYENTACPNGHKKNIKINSPEYPTIDKVAKSLEFPVKSDLTWWEPSPLKYIWPKYNLDNRPGGKSMDSANNYFVNIHSCRYFSNNANNTLHVKAYPDIKWTFEFFLNLTNDLSVKWVNQNDYDHKELQKKSGKIGAERRWKQKDASIGFSLKAKWNKDKQNKELKYEYETKFKKIYDLFASIGALSDGVTNKTKGTVRSISPKGTPLKFIVQPPNLSVTGDWFLSHPKDNQTIVGADVKIGVHASPLIGLEVTIDLLGALIFTVAGAISGGTASQPVTLFYNSIQGKLKKGIEVGDEKNGLKANVDIYMDLIITGTISLNADFKFHTEGKMKDSEFRVESENKLKVELKVGIKLKGEAVVAIFKAEAYFEASASGEASVTYGHGLNVDSKGVYYRPALGFDGLNAEYVVKVSASLAVKIAVDKNSVEETRDGEYVIAEGDFKNVIPPFDVIAELEELFNMKANIPIIRN